MQVISKFNKGFIYLLGVIDIHSKYAQVVTLKDKKITAITNTYQNILDESNCKPNKIWVGKSSEFYNRSMKSFFPNNCMEIYSRHNEGKSIIAKRLIRTLKNKI